MAETKKYRVTKKWPGGPEVGTVGDRYGMVDCAEVCFEGEDETWFKLNELQGFVEEVKEPEEFWYLNIHGQVDKWIGGVSFSDERFGIPDWLRFKTKEACEKFRDIMEKTHGHLFSHHNRESVELCESLNQRVTK